MLNFDKKVVFLTGGNSGIGATTVDLFVKIGGVMAGADYSASKAAVICLTKSLAKAGAPHGIRANSIAPAGINTPMVDQYHKKFPDKVKESIASKPLGRFGEAIEVAHTILFLASEEASYITGACVDVNGGMLMD